MLRSFISLLDKRSIHKNFFIGNIYDFVVDYKAIVGTTIIYDMHRYLMTKHNIKS